MKQIRAVIIAAVLALCTPMTARAEETCISGTAKEACIEIGESYGICPELLMAIIEHESKGEAYAENNGCVGLMQLNIKYYRGRIGKFGITDVYDEYSNILLGTDYLAELFGEYEDPAVVLMIYHGEKDSQGKAEQGRISKYANEILERSEELEMEHGK